MKNLLVILLFVSTLSCTQEATTSTQEATTFILVRHAEKASDDTSDPVLTEEGIARANNILQLFEQADITAIYSTNYKRTKMTITPLAETKKIEISIYDPQSLEEFAHKLLKENAGGTVIVSGHSNTTPTLANLLLGEEKFEQFEDTDYGNLLIITTHGNSDAKLLHVRY
jgi:2,3-bisphosphoglycerate-dependent phosphoglycerate mutase